MKTTQYKTKTEAREFFEGSRIQPENYSNIVDTKFADQLGEKLASLHLDNISKKTNMEKTKRLSVIKPLLFAGGGAMLGIVALFSFMFKDSLFNTTPKTLGGELAYSEGVVEYMNPGFGWMEIEDDVQIAEESSIRVLGEGKAIINLDDGSVVRLNSDSSVSFASLDPESIRISNDGGSVYTRIAKLDRNFEVTVDDVTYRSLGTAYKTINLEDKKGVRVYESAVEVIVKDRNGNITVEQGKKFFTLDESAVDNQDKVIAMSDKEINNDTFVKWNIEQDKEIEEYKDKLGVYSEKEMPMLEITSPMQVETKDGKVSVTGKTDARIKTNYGEKEVVNGEFSFEVEVPMGASDIIVKAINEDGVINEQRIKANRLEEEKEDVKVTPKPTKKVTDTPKSGVSSISLSNKGNGVVAWQTNGYSASGFKVAWSKNSNPTYPTRSGDKYAYLSSSSASSKTLTAFSGAGTYYVRVCEYLGGKCGVYSNQITITFEDTVAETGVNSISLSSAGGNNVSWSVNGTSVKGFKVVWSKTSGPTYPTRSGDKYAYLSSPSASSQSLTAFDGAGSYYVRVCEYLGGACGVYSNQITVNVD